MSGRPFEKPRFEADVALHRAVTMPATAAAQAIYAHPPVGRPPIVIRKSSTFVLITKFDLDLRDNFDKRFGCN